MKKWTTYTNETPEVKVNDSISKYIVEELGSKLTVFFSPDTTVGQRTALIKCVLAHLGDKLYFKVYANKLSDCLPPPSDGGKWKSREWLYDLHWYTENSGKQNGYQPTSLPLVVECEWSMKRKEDNNDPFSAIKFDFQKLLVANAKLRLMIFKITRGKDHNMNSVLDSYFDKAIKSYGNLEEDPKFLFIAFDERINGFHYAEKPKGQGTGKTARWSRRGR